MVNFRQAQTGNRVYRGASQAPNRGQVSARGAQGYIQRELRNKNNMAQQRQLGGRPVANPRGGDGLSDNRSAVAAKAMERKQMFQNGGRTPGTRPGGKIPFNNQGRPVMGPGGKQPYNNQGRPPGGGPNPPGSPAGTPPTVTVTKDGILQLPYNQQYAQSVYDATDQANQQLLDLKMGADAHNLEYTAAKRDADLAYQSLKGQTLSGNAARGTAFSSQYGTAVANNARGYANQVADLDAGNASFNQNLALQRSTIQNALNQQIQLGSQQQAGQLAQLAGTLGYGQQQQQINKKRSPARPNKHKGKKSKGPKRRNNIQTDPRNHDFKRAAGNYLKRRSR